MQEPNSQDSKPPSSKMSAEQMQQYTSEALDRFISVPSEDYGSFLKMFRNLKEEDVKLSQTDTSQAVSSEVIELDAATKIHVFQETKKFQQQQALLEPTREDTDGMELVADLEVEQGITPFSMDGPGIVKTDNFVEDEDIPTEDAVFYTPSFDAPEASADTSNNNPQLTTMEPFKTIPHQRIVQDEDGIRTDADIMLDEINRLQQQGVTVDMPISKAGISTETDEDFVLLRNDPLPDIESTDTGVAMTELVEAFELDSDFDYENVPFVPKGFSKEEEQHLARLREEKIIP